MNLLKSLSSGRNLQTLYAKWRNKNWEFLQARHAIEPVVICYLKLSSNCKLVPVIALKFRLSEKNQTTKSYNNPNEMRTAKQKLLRLLLMDSFPDEFEQMQKDNPVNQPSKVVSASSILASQGLLHYCGINLRRIDFNTKHAIFKVGPNHTLRLYLGYFHEKNQKHTMRAIVRQRFQRTKLRMVLRSLQVTCLTGKGFR